MVNDRVTLCPDGKYRWCYEVNLYKNTQILRDLLLVLGVAFGFVFLLMALLEIGEGASFSNLLQLFLVFLGLTALMYLIGVVSYYIWAMVNGGSYCVLFIMDEKSITHQQMPKEVRKSQVLGAITALAGLMAGSATATGTGLLAANSSTWRTEFGSVRRIKPIVKRNLIKVNELITKNRIFVPYDDYHFVLDFISQRCPKAK